MAHASSRVPRHSAYSLGYYVAVAACCLFVISGWWLTLGPSLERSVSKEPDPLAQSVSQEWEAFRQNAATLKFDNDPSKNALEEAKRQLQTASSTR